MHPHLRHPVLMHPKAKKYFDVSAKLPDYHKVKNMPGKGKKKKSASVIGDQKKESESSRNENTEPEIEEKEPESNVAVDEDEPKIAGLKCAAYGGPSDEIASKEMVYWSDIPSDAEYISPFKQNNDAKGGTTQYMVSYDQHFYEYQVLRSLELAFILVKSMPELRL